LDRRWPLAGVPPANVDLEENMEKKIAGLIGAIASLGAFTAAEAAPVAMPAPSEILKADSYADLLEPIPNAVALLQVVDEAGPTSSVADNVQLVQFYYHHHHHHHHHSQYRRRYAPRIVVVPPRFRRYHHHHHHHHHSMYRRDY
jgi:hypothetical protein